MGYIILDLGSEVNVLPKKTWKCMGEPTLGYSLVQLKLENQHRVLPIGRLKGVTVDLDGVRTKDDFELIEIWMAQHLIRHYWVWIENLITMS
jgi:hypothetical protein